MLNHANYKSTHFSLFATVNNVSQSQCLSNFESSRKSSLKHASYLLRPSKTKMVRKIIGAECENVEITTRLKIISADFSASVYFATIREL